MNTTQSTDYSTDRQKTTGHIFKKTSNKQINKIVDFKEIPEQTKINGLQLVKRVDGYALYVTNCFSFEIHKIRTLKDYYNPFLKTLYRTYEKIASTEEFGYHGWCYDRLTTAINQFDIFSNYKQEIIDKLDELGYEQLLKSKRGVQGYLL